VIQARLWHELETFCEFLVHTTQFIAFCDCMANLSIQRTEADDKLDILQGMGLSENAAKRALLFNGNNLEDAATWCDLIDFENPANVVGISIMLQIQISINRLGLW
jgi:hypothetical protein